MFGKIYFGILALLLQNAIGFVRFTSRPIKFHQNVVIMNKTIPQKKVSSLSDSISKISFRVKNLEESIAFYTGSLRMKIVEKNDAEKKCILGYETTDQYPFCIEIQGGLVDELSIGDGFQGIGLSFDDVDKVSAAALSNGGALLLDIDDYYYGASLVPDEDDLKQFPVRYGKITDPNGYTIELKKENRAYPIHKVTLSVLDLDETVSYYSKNFNLKQLRRRSNVISKPREASFCAYVGKENESKETYLELIYHFATDSIEIGNGFQGLTISSTVEDLKLSSEIIEGNDPASGLLLTKDPNNYQVIIQKI